MLLHSLRLTIELILSGDPEEWPLDPIPGKDLLFGELQALTAAVELLFLLPPLFRPSWMPRLWEETDEDTCEGGWLCCVLGDWWWWFPWLLWYPCLARFWWCERDPPVVLPPVPDDKTQHEDEEKEEEKETPLLLMVLVHSVRFTSLVVLPLFWKNPRGTICILKHPSSAAWGALDGTSSAHLSW